MIDTIYDRKNGTAKAKAGKVEIELTAEEEAKIHARINDRVKDGKVL